MSLFLVACITLLWTGLIFNCLAVDLHSTCTSGCVREFVDQVSNQLPNAKGKLNGLTWQEIINISSSSHNVDTDTKTFKVICKEYKQMRRCTKDCGKEQSHHLSIINSTFTVAEHICVTKYDPFQRQLPCFAKHNREIQERCEGLQNGTKMFATDTLASDKTGGDKAKPQLTELLAHLCEINHRVTTCLIPETLRLCGVEAALLIREIVQLNVENLVYLHKALRLRDPLPIQCEQGLMAGSSTSTPSSAPIVTLPKSKWSPTTTTATSRVQQHFTSSKGYRLTTKRSRPIGQSKSQSHRTSKSFTPVPTVISQESEVASKSAPQRYSPVVIINIVIMVLTCQLLLFSW